MDQDKCQIDGCSKPATHLTTSETNYIEICSDHYNEKYKK
jgi:hypothetical protein